jgi:Helix-turn-helix domain
LAIGVVFPLS